MLGGWLTWMWGWRAVFAFLSAVGVVMLLVYARKLPESLPPARRQAIRLGSLWRNYRLVLGSPWFMRLSVAHACNWAAMYLYVAAGPQLVTHLLGRPPTDVYLVFTPMMVGLIVGFLCLPRVLQRWGTQRTMYLAYSGFVLVNVVNITLAAACRPAWCICCPSRPTPSRSRCPCRCSWAMRCIPFLAMPGWPHRANCSCNTA